MISTVLAFGYASENTLEEQLLQASIKAVCVGDCAKVGKVLDAVAAGASAALEI